MASGIVVRVRVRDEGEVESARRRSVRRRASKNAARPFWKSEASGFGEKYLHDGARRFGPRRARRGGATRSATRRWRPTLLTRIVAGRTKGGGRTFRGGGERSSAFPARRAGCDWRQPASARSGAHRATPRLRAFQRPRRRGRPRRGRGRASERVSKRHRHEIAPANRAGRAMITLPGCGAVLEEERNLSRIFVFAVRERCSGQTRSNLPKGGRKIERILRMGIDIAYYRTIAYMGRRLTLPGLSATRRAVAARRELPDSPAAPHFTGGEPAAPGERIPAEPARSVEGSERHRGRLEAHWAPESSFSRLAPGRVAASGRVPPLHAFAPRAGDRGKPGPETMPTDRVDEPQVVPWLEKDDLAYYGPFRCVSRPAPRDADDTRATFDAAPTTAVFAREAGVGERFDSLSAPSEETRAPSPGDA